MSSTFELRESASDPSLLSSRSPSSERDYMFVDSSNIKYKKPPVHFSVIVTSIDDDYNKTICHPGSTFTGYIQLNIDYPLAAQCIQLLFRATEQIHDNKKEKENLFSIREILWGLPSVTGTQWPVIKPGNHRFQFLCEMPQVNYPPTYKHPMASCDFEILASLERPGTRPFQTIPFPISYQPLVLTNPLKTPRAHQEYTSLSNNTITIILPKGCSYNLLDNHNNHRQLDVFLLLNTRHTAPKTFELSLRKEVHVAGQPTDTVILSHVDQSSFRTKVITEGCIKHFIQIPIPTESSLHSKKQSGITPTLTEHSDCIRIVYKLVVTAKVRRGLRSQKLILFSIPVQMGTLPFGVQVPSNIVSYYMLPPDTTSKPRFLYLPSNEEQLPAYQDEVTPPLYS
ncbi:unnamed protein product [Rhizopus stolonifer]